jgi:two-component system, OmpR family, phosphate regulon sensor histidine kinase PhoR
MRVRTIIPVVSLIVAALAGLIYLQVYLLNNAFALREQAFRQNVRTALGAAALKLQAGETLSRVRRYSLTSASKAAPGSGLNAPRSLVRHATSSAVERNDGPHQWVSIHVYSGAHGDTIVRDTIREPDEYTVGADTPAAGNRGYTYGYFTDSSSMVLKVGKTAPGETVHASSSERDKLFIVSTVYDDLMAEEKGIDSKVNPALLDSVLTVSMHEAGIALPFAYGILLPRVDSVLLATPPSAARDLRNAEFHVPLFHLAFGPPQGELVVFFSGRGAYLFAQIWPALIASVLFILIIALCFVYTVRTILRQQHLAGRMVEFINNMTHEFKTPLATVTLASEAIQRPDVMRDGVRVRKYNAMIAEETLRMKTQVDRILQMAVIEEGDYELTLSDVDLHAVIRAAVDNSTLQVESRRGRITCDLEAEHHTVRGDAVHIGNIIRNLLDNALKYSPGAPEIRVSTANEARLRIVRVSDKGIGIAPEHVERVFDKYYRVPTGNLHEVKGFGLGLSYVRLLVRAHGGSIAIRSRPGEGTEVEVRFPEGPPA